MKQRWLGADPGTANFSVSVVEYDTETEEIKLLYVGMLENPIKNLTANPVRSKPRRGKKALERDEPRFDIGVILFRDEMLWIIRHFNVTHFAGERFQTRGGFKGDSIESISIMLGIIFEICVRRKIVYFTTIAGVWKNAMARLGSDLPSLYSHGKMIDKRIEPHMIDSTLIACWHSNREKAWANKSLLKAIGNCLDGKTAVVAF